MPCGQLKDIKGTAMGCFEIGQVFENEYPAEAAIFCNEQGDCFIKEIDTGDAIRRFQIVAVSMQSTEEARAIKLIEINNEYTSATSNLIANYPDTELLTFDKQETEARAWLSDNTVSTPLIDMLAAGRQMDKAELVDRIIAKADAFTLAAGYLTGQRQHYEDMLGAAGTLEDIESIKPVYTLPETA